MVAPLRFERHSRGRLGVKQHRENENGEIITLENLDWILREATREHLNPSVLIKHEFDRSWTWRFFAKLGLAAGHYFFGEEFSRSNRAAALRKGMNASSYDDLSLPGALIFPDIESLPPQIFKLKSFRTIVVTNGRPRILMVSLFGWLNACMLLDDVTDGRQARVSGKLEVVGIELPKRSWGRYSLADFLKIRRAANGTLMRREIVLEGRCNLPG